MAAVQDEDSCELFECGVCMESLLDKQPRTLSCNHTYCEQCLKQMVRFNSIKCPQCRTSTSLPIGGVNKLPLNFELAKMKEREVEMAKKFAVMCQVCLRRHAHTKAEFKCIQCFQTMCKPCKQKHGKVEVFKSHTVEELSGSQYSSNICSTHQQAIAYICQRCVKGICMDCLLDDEHVDHQDRVEDLAEGIKGIRNAVHEISRVLKECQEKLNVTANAVTKDLDQATTVKEQVAVRKKEVESLIDKEYQDLLNTVKTKFEHPMVGSLDAIRATIGKVKSTIDLCKTLTSGDDDLDLIAKLHEIKSISTKLIQSANNFNKDLYSLPKFTPKNSGSSSLLGSIESGGTASTETVEYVAEPVTESKLLLILKQQDGKLKIKNPVELLCLEDNSLLLADSDVPFVQRISMNGNLMAKYYAKFDGEKIYSISMSRGDLYIGQESGITIVPCITSSRSTHAHIKHEIKSRDSIAVTREGVIYHSQFSNGRILEVDSDGECHGVLGGVSRPVYIHIADTSDGLRYFVTEYFAHRVSIFDEEWDKLTSFGKQGSGDGCLWCPGATAMASGNEILVADSVNNRVSLFSLRGRFLRHVLRDGDGLDSPAAMAYRHPYLWLSEYRTPGHSAIKLFQLAE